jgi:putative DNA primase/helicase
MTSTFTDPAEFGRFHELLMKDAPKGFYPFYFTLEKNGKDPLKGTSWKNSRQSFEDAYKLMEKGFNIGIAATDKDKLVIVDIDDLKQIKDPKPTLMNQSRKRIGRHCFYFTEDSLARTIFDNSAKQNIATEDAGEVRSVWQYVVAAGSFVPCAPEELAMIPEEDRVNAGKYSIMVEHTVTKITYDQLPEAYRTCLENKRAVDIANKQRKHKRPVSQDKESKFKSALWELTIYDVTGKKDAQDHRFPSPFHGSKTYKDTSVSHGMLHCWRHSCSHTALTYLAVECNLSTCSNAGYKHNSSGASDVDFLDPGTIYELWIYAKNKGFIPTDDPMPTKAMIYYALQEKMCAEKDIEDGWKFPTEVYNKIIETAPFNVGREPIKAKAEKIGQAVQNAMFDAMQIAHALQDSCPIYYDPARNYWLWDDEKKKYNRIDETEILCQVTSNLDLTVCKSNLKNEILEAIRNTGRRRKVRPTPKSWIQFENCVFDIETGETFTASPEYFFVSPIPHKLGESPETPIIDGLFKSWHSEKADHLCEICAYCLYDAYPIQRIFALVGSGSNGKGQFMKLLRTFIGFENCVSTDLDKLAKSQFEASKLYKKKAAFIGETNYNTLSQTNMLKALSGGDLVSCEYKGRDSFDFVNTAKIILATNGLPATTDRSDGFYRRWNITEFRNKFKDGKDIVDSVPEIEYENFGRKCVNLLRELLKAGKFLYEEEQDKRRDKYESLSNPVQAFINEECIVMDDVFVPIWFIYEQYDHYREKRGHRKISKREFTAILRSMDFETGPKKYNSEMQEEYSDNPENFGKNWKSVFGLRLRETSHSYLGTNMDVYSATGNGSENVGLNEGYEITPLQMLDREILKQLKRLYPNKQVPDLYEFERKFCSEVPYFAGSLVRARVQVLKSKNWTI